MKNNGYAWGAIIAVVIIAAAVLVFHIHDAMAPGPNASSTAMGTTTVDLGNGVTATLPPGATLHESTTTAGTAVQPPSLSGAISISSSLPSDAQTALRIDEQTTIAELKAAPTRVDLWLQLGVDRKIGGDYAGAIQAWQYVAEAAPASLSYVAYGDLGDLYQNFDVNYAKAEADYKAAIAINPNVIQYYTGLYYLYRYNENNISAANAIVAQGLKANPGNAELEQLSQ